MVNYRLKMDKKQFIDRHRNLMIQQQELERKWRMYVREQEELALMQEAQLRSTMSGVGGGLTEDYMEDSYMIEAVNYVD